ncbi:MAG: bifunctional 2',3'-cyclic-nucleotide 2'-phosphodiesterase/3'-nucleotidase [Pseudomonadota bacterium]
MLRIFLVAILALSVSCACAADPPQGGARATLALLETTDLHANIVGYDYYKLAPDASLGLERTASLIRAARTEFANSLLFDDGDAIQGTALADYQASIGAVPCEQTLAIYKAMNLLAYDGATIGNHEFNFGLPFLNQVTGSHFDVDGVAPDAPRCAGPTFPLVLANVYSTRTRQPLFAPFHIIEKQIAALDAAGKPMRTILRVGIIGVAPPNIVMSDRRWLDGKVYTEGMRESVQKYLPQMRAQGADLIVVLCHGGIERAPYSPMMADAALYLAQLDGIDALLIGHAHQLFPSTHRNSAADNADGIDHAKGTIHGVPTVMAGLWGKQLGVIALDLVHDGRGWHVDKGRTTVEVRGTQLPDKSFVAPEAAIGALVAPEHAGAIAYVKSPVGSTQFRMASYFADLGDVSALAVVNLAQVHYVAEYVRANLPQYASLPILSAHAAQKTGAAGVRDYTDVAAGSLALNNAADLYLYPNILYVVKINGAQLKAWLERSAKRFNTIDPARTTAQELIDPASFGFNYDVFTSKELRYDIDLSQAAGARIKSLRFKDEDVRPDQEFLVATNNYRASGGGAFPGLDGSKTVYASPDTCRDVLIDFIRANKTLTRAEHGSGRSAQFRKLKTSGPIVFHSAPGVLDVAHQAGLANVSLLASDDGGGKGYALYGIDLSR